MTIVEEKLAGAQNEELLTGCEAVAQAVMLADVDVIAAYPIRPYTEVMDAVSKLIADGKFFAATNCKVRLTGLTSLARRCVQLR